MNNEQVYLLSGERFKRGFHPAAYVRVCYSLEEVSLYCSSIEDVMYKLPTDHGLHLKDAQELFDYIDIHSADSQSQGRYPIGQIFAQQGQMS